LQISVVEVMIWKESFALKVPGHERISASDMLKTFCKWQAHLPSKTGPYDVALLLTR
jgi:hypothetical protein